MNERCLADWSLAPSYKYKLGMVDIIPDAATMILITAAHLFLCHHLLLVAHSYLVFDATNHPIQHDEQNSRIQCSCGTMRCDAGIPS